MVHRTSSPSRSHEPRLAPIPGGVPVIMTVPGGSVEPWERYATILVSVSVRSGCYAACAHSETCQIMFCALPDWTSWPLTRVWRVTSAGSGSDVVDTSTGPSGQNLSKPIGQSEFSLTCVVVHALTYLSRTPTVSTASADCAPSSRWHMSSRGHTVSLRSCSRFGTRGR